MSATLSSGSSPGSVAANPKKAECFGVMRERLLVRVHGARRIARLEEVLDRLLGLVRLAEVSGEQAVRLGRRLFVEFLECAPDAPVELATSRPSRLAYATSWTSPCRKRYSGAGRRRSSTTSSSRWSSARAGSRASRGATRSSSGSPKLLPTTAATLSTWRVSGSSRSRRAWSASCTSSGISNASIPTASS